MLVFDNLLYMKFKFVIGLKVIYLFYFALKIRVILNANLMLITVMMFVQMCNLLYNRTYVKYRLYVIKKL